MTTYDQRWGHPRTRRTTHPRREQRRIEALERNAEWAEMTPGQKLLELYHRPGLSTKQVKRIRVILVREG